MPSLAATIAHLGIQKSDFDTKGYAQTGRQIEELNRQLVETILPLKAHLSKEKTKDGPFDLTGDLANGTRIVDAILDFQNLYEHSYGNGKTLTIEDLDLEALGEVTKEQVTEILSHVDNVETAIKTKTQDGTQRLFLDLQMSMTVFNILSEGQKTHAQHMTSLTRNQRAG